MNERFLQFYEDELRHVREMAADFGALHPLVAGQLRIRKDGCDDPFVERLLEGFAFLSARIHEQIDQEFPVFTQSLLESIYPGLLCPTPSMGIVQLNASDSIGGKLEVPAGTELTGPLGDNSPSKCLFRTAHKVDLFPIDLINEGEEGVSYFDRDLNALNLPKSSQAESAIRLRINQLDDDSTFDEAEDIDELTFFVKGDLSAAGRIYEEIVSKTIELSVGELRKGKKQYIRQLNYEVLISRWSLLGFLLNKHYYHLTLEFLKGIDYLKNMLLCLRDFYFLRSRD